MKILAFIILYTIIYGEINPGLNKFTQIQYLTFPIYFIYLFLKTKFKIVMNKKIICFFIIFFIVHFMTKFINAEKALFSGPFFYISIKAIIKMTASFVLYKVISKIKKNKKERIIYILEKFVDVILFDLSLGLLRYIFPSLNKIFFLLNNINNNLTNSGHLMYSLKEGFRLVGFGGSFFGAGCLTGIALVVITFLQTKNKKNKLWVKYLIILVLGIMTSRTTFIGIMISFLYYFTEKKNYKKIYKKFIYIPLLIILVTLIKNINTKIYNWTFEIFIKKGSSASTDILIEFFKIIPKNIKTWLIGDGKWMVENGIDYYMQTDVGYFRIIWYAGLIGLIVFLSYNFLLFYIIKKKSDYQLSKLMLSFLLLVLIYNIKGYFPEITLNYILIVFLMEENKFKYQIKKFNMEKFDEN